MYDYLRGRVASRDGGSVVLDCGGVGYRLLVSATTLSRVPADGEFRLYIAVRALLISTALAPPFLVGRQRHTRNGSPCCVAQQI